MRQLTQKQKKLLTNWKRDNSELTQWGDLEIEQMEQLEAINDTEILTQEVTRFLWDLK